MSDTPRTDAAAYSGPRSSHEVVSAAFARQLERELARVQPVVEAAREADWWFDHSAQNAVDGPYDFDEEAAALRQAIRALDAKEVK